jgi:hypothetical protein
MRLIQNERAYAELIEAFVEGRASAEEFLPLFSHLWRCDANGHLNDGATISMTDAERGFYGAIDSISNLCECYRQSFPAGCGYRVSAEQFRKQLESLASAHPVLALNLSDADRRA